jgi:hypothetical protein
VLVIYYLHSSMIRERKTKRIVMHFFGAIL